MTDKVVSIAGFRNRRKDDAAKSIEPESKRGKPPAEQLSLPMDSQPKILVFPLDEVHGAAFLEKLDQHHSVTLIDFRAFRHFNLLGTGPNLPRQAIQRVAVMYVTEEIPVDCFSRSLADAKVLSTHCKHAFDVAGRSSNVFFVLVHKKSDACLLVDVINGEFASRSGGAEIEVITQVEAIAM